MKEHIKILPNIISPLNFSKDQSELYSSGMAFVMSKIGNETLKNLYPTMKIPCPFDKNDNNEATLQITISKYICFGSIIYIAHVTIIANDKLYNIGYSVSNNFKFIFDSIRKTILGKKHLSHLLNHQLRRFGVKLTNINS